MNAPRPDRERFAAKLRRLRDLNGHMTQEELAQRSGVDVALIRNYEQEKSLAKDDALVQLARALDASPATFRACSLQNIKLLDDAAQVRIAAQLLFQISDTYDLLPAIIDGIAGVRGNGGYIEFALIEWANLIEADEEDTDAALADGIKPESYRAVQDKMVSTFAELNHFELGYNEPWDEPRCPALPPTLGDTLKRLRKAHRMSQLALADAGGISLFSVRAYEQGKRVPTDEQREALADVLQVPVEVLSEFGITNSNDAFHYLLELSHIFGLRPRRIGDAVVLAHTGRKKPLNKLFNNWHMAWIELEEAGDKAAYQNWKDGYKG